MDLQRTLERRVGPIISDVGGRCCKKKINKTRSVNARFIASTERREQRTEFALRHGLRREGPRFVEAGVERRRRRLEFAAGRAAQRARERIASAGTVVGAVEAQFLGHAIGGGCAGQSRKSSEVPTSSAVVVLRYWQRSPRNSRGHWHVLRPRQMPPFWQGGLQTAEQQETRRTETSAGSARRRCTVVRRFLTLAVGNSGAGEGRRSRHPGSVLAVKLHFLGAGGELVAAVALGRALLLVAEDARVHRHRRLVHALGLDRILAGRTLKVGRALALVGRYAKAQVLARRHANGCGPHHRQQTHRSTSRRRSVPSRPVTYAGSRACRPSFRPSPSRRRSRTPSTWTLSDRETGDPPNRSWCSHWSTTPSFVSIEALARHWIEFVFVFVFVFVHFTSSWNTLTWRWPASVAYRRNLLQ